MIDIRDILREGKVVFETAMAVSFKSSEIYYIFRNNGEQIEIDVKNKTVSNQLIFSEINFIDENYPFFKIETFLIRKKTYT